MPKKYTFSFFLDSITVSMKNIWHGVLKFKAVDWLNKIYFLRWPDNFLAFFLENDIFLRHNFSDLLGSKGSWEPKNDCIKKIKSVLSSSEHVFLKNQSLKVIQASWFWGFVHTLAHCALGCCKWTLWNLCWNLWDKVAFSIEKVNPANEKIVRTNSECILHSSKDWPKMIMSSTYIPTLMLFFLQKRKIGFVTFDRMNPAVDSPKGRRWNLK